MNTFRKVVLTKTQNDDETAEKQKSRAARTRTRTRTGPRPRPNSGSNNNSGGWSEPLLATTGKSASQNTTTPLRVRGGSNKPAGSRTTNTRGANTASNKKTAATRPVPSISNAAARPAITARTSPSSNWKLSKNKNKTSSRPNNISDGNKPSEATSSSQRIPTKKSISKKPPTPQNIVNNNSRNGGNHGQTATAASLAETSRTLYANAPATKWKCSDLKFTGSFSYDAIGRQEQVTGKSVAKAIQDFQANPDKYVAIMYQTDMVKIKKCWPVDQHSYTLIHRDGTVRFQPQGASTTSNDGDGWMTILVQEYQHLPPFKDNQLPSQYRDEYTDDMVHHGRKIHSKYNPPILPGRGMGVGDTPLLKIIGDIDPSDIHQGQVGDCWLLSAISALAEFDGAVKRLFRKTKDLNRMPLATGSPNQYIITLWDLGTWKEIDIVVDERLAAAPGGSGQLLASKPSEDGEMWVCYLEKALAVHCGGWDKITGGQCSHAWSLMTGCREQYTIRKNKKTDKYACFAKYNPRLGKWVKHHNCPQENNGDLWRVAWPAVGGGGGIQKELDEEDLFMKMFAWDRENFIVGAGTNGTSDKNLSDGMVDNHASDIIPTTSSRLIFSAYSVIECVNDAAGTDIDLFKVRNPWGKGEIENGEFDDDGPGWDQYPQVKRLLKPVVADDGIFWLTRKEFFKLFDHIYVSASNMTEFLED